jgi:hypothetical protein
MAFVYETVPQEDVEKYDLIALGKKHWTSNFDSWVVDKAENNFLLYIRSGRIDEGDEGYSYHLIYFKEFWGEVTLQSVGEYIKGKKYSLISKCTHPLYVTNKEDIILLLNKSLTCWAKHRTNNEEFVFSVKTGELS